MSQKAVLSHGYYKPYFYWMFPIVVASEKGIFEEEGVDLKINDIVSGGQPEDKANWYKDALDAGTRDFYFCCAWQGVYSTCATGRGRIGAGLRSTLIKTFAIYSKPDSGFENVLDIAKREAPIAVNKNADAHYVTLKNLTEFIPENQIKFAHLGGVEKCFKALINDEVEVATLAGPYAEAAEAMGYRRLLPLSRTEPTFVVLEEHVGESTAKSFFNALNKAIDLINGNREEYRIRYLREFREVVEKYLPEISENIDSILPKVRLPAWAAVEPVTRNEFNEIQSFLVEKGLSVEGRNFDSTVESVINVGAS
jgi:ABC-type nitrate/sulfonate/bicarbonate transport system substrate-binding protein